MDTRKYLLNYNPMLQSSSGCFQGVSLSEGINNAFFQVPSSSQFQFPDVLEAEFRLDPEFRQRVVGLERMLRVRDSLQAKSACAAENDAHDSVSECGSCKIALKNRGPEVSSGRGCRSLRGVCRQFDRGGEHVHAIAGASVENRESRHGNLGLLEPDLSRKHSSNSTAEKVAGHELLHATADERSGVICLLEASDGDVRTGRATTAGESTGITGSLERYVSETSLLNSENSSMGVACVESALPAGAPFASVFSPCPFAARVAAAVHARRTVSPMHGEKCTKFVVGHG